MTDRQTDRQFCSAKPVYHSGISDPTLPVPDPSSAQYDYLHKVRPLISALKKTCSCQMKPSRDMSIDESILKYKGRLGIVQYIPRKPGKMGIKVWMLAASRCRFQVETVALCHWERVLVGNKVCPPAFVKQVQVVRSSF